MCCGGEYTHGIFGSKPGPASLHLFSGLLTPPTRMPINPPPIPIWPLCSSLAAPFHLQSSETPLIRAVVVTVAGASQMERGCQGVVEGPF